MPDSWCVPLCCKSGYRVGPDGKKITYHCLPTDAVRLKYYFQNSRSLSLSFKISDISRYDLYLRSGL